MKKFCWIILTFTFALLTSCIKNIQEPLPKNYYDYCGKWNSFSNTLEITEFGSGSYSFAGSPEQCKVFFEGWNIRFHPVEGIGNKRFHIDQPPYTDSLTGKMMMKLSGEIFYRN
jgi:hypothetical protein